MMQSTTQAHRCSEVNRSCICLRDNLHKVVWRYVAIMSSSDKISSVALTCSDTVDMQVWHLRVKLWGFAHKDTELRYLVKCQGNCILRYVFKPKAFRFIKFVNKIRSFRFHFWVMPVYYIFTWNCLTILESNLSLSWYIWGMKFPNKTP